MTKKELLEAIKHVHDDEEIKLQVTSSKNGNSQIGILSSVDVSMTPIYLIAIS